jgi:hypothetical protein
MPGNDSAIENKISFLGQVQRNLDARDAMPPYESTDAAKRAIENGNDVYAVRMVVAQVGKLKEKLINGRIARMTEILLADREVSDCSSEKQERMYDMLHKLCGREFSLASSAFLSATVWGDGSNALYPGMLLTSPVQKTQIYGGVPSISLRASDIAKHLE